MQTRSASVHRVAGQSVLPGQDELAAEEPLQISIAYSFKGQRLAKDIAVTMRTPGHDRELAAGFLFTEGVIQSAGQIDSIGGQANEIRVELAASVDVDNARLQRNFYMTSSCGVCGKASLDALECDAPPVEGPL